MVFEGARSARGKQPAKHLPASERYYRILEPETRTPRRRSAVRYRRVEGGVIIRWRLSERPEMLCMRGIARC